MVAPVTLPPAPVAAMAVRTPVTAHYSVSARPSSSLGRSSSDRASCEMTRSVKLAQP